MQTRRRQATERRGQHQKTVPADSAAASPHVGYQPKVLIGAFGEAALVVGNLALPAAYLPARPPTLLRAEAGREDVVVSSV